MRKSRISKVKQQKLLEHFVAGTASRCTAEIVGVDHKSASYYFHRLREVIDYQLKQETLDFLDGEIELDEAQFHEEIRVPDSNKIGGKIPLFILVGQNENIYTKAIPYYKPNALIPLQSKKIKPSSIICSDSWKGINSENISSELKDYKVCHSKEIVGNYQYTNEAEIFWRCAKQHMQKYKGFPRKHFPLYLKECEWRFNTPTTKLQLRQLKQWVIGELS